MEVYDLERLTPYLYDLEYYENNLYLDDSNIVGAGRGVFTNIYLRKNTIIAEYRGRRYSENKILSGESIKYSFQTPDGTIILPYESTIARYINDIIDLNKTINTGTLSYLPLHYNVDWLIAEDYSERRPLYRQRVFIITTDNIDKGDELYINYDKPYWREWIDQPLNTLRYNDMTLTGENLYSRIILSQRRKRQEQRGSR